MSSCQQFRFYTGNTFELSKALRREDKDSTAHRCRGKCRREMHGWFASVWRGTAAFWLIRSINRRGTTTRYRPLPSQSSASMAQSVPAGHRPRLCPDSSRSHSDGSDQVVNTLTNVRPDGERWLIQWEADGDRAVSLDDSALLTFYQSSLRRRMPRVLQTDGLTLGDGDWTSNQRARLAKINNISRLLTLGRASLILRFTCVLPPPLLPNVAAAWTNFRGVMSPPPHTAAVSRLISGWEIFLTSPL